LLLFLFDMQDQTSEMKQQKLVQADVQFSKAFIAGGGAGMLAALVTCPVEVVKTKLQVFHLNFPIIHRA
jgi:hypothetical protein